MKDEKQHSDLQRQNRSRFFEAALPLYMKHGFRKTTVEEICSAAKMSKPTFYKLFNDKSDLFAQCVLFLSDRAVEEWQTQLTDEADPASKLNSFLDFYWTVLCKHPLARIIIEEPKVIEEFAHLIYTTPNSPVLTAFRNILEEGVKKSQFRDLNPDVVLYIIYSILDSMFLIYPIMTGKPGSGEDPVVTEEVRTFILRGVGATDERK